MSSFVVLSGISRTRACVFSCFPTHMHSLSLPHTRTHSLSHSVPLTIYCERRSNSPETSASRTRAAHALDSCAHDSALSLANTLSPPPRSPSYHSLHPPRSPSYHSLQPSRSPSCRSPSYPSYHAVPLTSLSLALLLATFCERHSVNCETTRHVLSRKRERECVGASGSGTA